MPLEFLGALDSPCGLPRVSPERASAGRRANRVECIGASGNSYRSDLQSFSYVGVCVDEYLIVKKVYS